MKHLSSWNDGSAKQSIIDFVNRVTQSSSPDFVVPERRIATFDNDGTLWSEQPMYFQLAFILDRVKFLAPVHPEWKERQPFKAALEGDFKTVISGGIPMMLKLAMASHAGNTTEEYSQLVRDWLATARHPRINRPYTDMVFQPMVELLAYLRANEFKNYIISGGGVEFMRPWTESIYGIPPEQVVGSTSKTKFKMRNGQPMLIRLPEVNIMNDKGDKPVCINQHIGRRPIAAFGNSDGDLQMLQWTAAGKGARYMLLVHHTDAEREWAYDKKSEIGHLDQALDEAFKRNWNVVDMKKDWKVIYPFQL